MEFNPTESEVDLIARAQTGDRGAFGELLQRHQSGVIRVVYHLCGDAHLAEDAAQEAFIRAWINLPSYRPKSPLRNWLYRIAVNVALDMLRSEKRTSPDDIDNLPLKDHTPGPEDTIIAHERIQQVQNAVQALPTSSRVVLILREYEGLSYQEIASMLDIPIGTVMSRLNYARSRLREILRTSLFSMEVEHA